jgi:carbon monoxide dehydrogenase subunit G
MKIEKQFVIEAPHQEVWDFITAPEKIAACIPGCQEVEEIEPGRYKAAVRVAVGPIKTTFKVNVEATETRPPEYAEYLTQGDEGGRASRLKATSSLTLKALEANKTEVAYASDINVVGRLGKFGMGMMKKKADSMGDDFVEALRAQIENDSDDGE